MSAWVFIGTCTRPGFLEGEQWFGILNGQNVDTLAFLRCDGSFSLRRLIKPAPLSEVASVIDEGYPWEKLWEVFDYDDESMGWVSLPLFVEQMGNLLATVRAGGMTV